MIIAIVIKYRKKASDMDLYYFLINTIVLKVGGDYGKSRRTEEKGGDCKTSR